MVQCIAAFMNACYIARRNVIKGPALEHFQTCVEQFHHLRNIFIQAGVRASISLPRQHALSHYYYAIQLFGSPNGLCSSITESKHIKAVKEPWRRSNRFHALIQMLQILVRLDKMATLRRVFSRMGMLAGSTSSYYYMADTNSGLKVGSAAGTRSEDSSLNGEDDGEDSMEDSGPAAGSQSDALSDVKLAMKCRMS